MRRKVFATVVTLVLSATMLAGCGNSADSSTAIYEEPVNPAVYAEDDEDTPKVSANDEAEKPPKESSEENANDEATEAPTADSEPATSSGLVNAAEEDVPESGEVEGIVIAQGSWQDFFTFCFTIYTIDPATGASRKLNQFVYDSINELDSDYILPPWRLGFAFFGNLSDNFSSDYTKVVATKTFVGSGEKHAGWLDANGNFFDVTVALGEQAQDDFDEPAMYYGVGFQDDIFIYVTSDYGTYYGVAMDNITPGASWEIDTADRLLALDYDTWHWMGDYRPTCWIDDDRALVEKTQNRHGDKKCRIATVSTQTLEIYLPGEDTHSNWSAVVSPDGDKVAFFSQRIGGEDINMYTASISGDNPTKLESDFVPSFTLGSGATPVNGGNFCYILEWR